MSDELKSNEHTQKTLLADVDNRLDMAISLVSINTQALVKSWFTTFINTQALVKTVDVRGMYSIEKTRVILNRHAHQHSYIYCFHTHVNTAYMNWTSIPIMHD